MTKPLFAVLAAVSCAGQLAGKTIPNYARANLVLGQENFTAESVYPPDALTMNAPTGVAVDPVTRKVFVSEWGGNRILRFPPVSSLSNGAIAEAVFGQPRFTSNGSGSGDRGMDGPDSIFFDRRGRLWVVDRENSRVLAFEAASYRESTPNADRVIGQADFSTNSSGLSATTLSFPVSVCVDSGDRLWIADKLNYRVLRYDSITIRGNGPAADGVLGQLDFTSAVIATSSSQFQPTGLCTSPGGALFVGDPFANRILRFDDAAILADGSPANIVLGQTNFTDSSPGLSAAKLAQPFIGCFGADGSLWVGDYDNKRILRFNNAAQKATGASANGVLGQPGFMTQTPGVTQRDIGGIYQVMTLDATGSLWVPDLNNDRVLRFPPDVTPPTLTVTSSVPANTSKNSITIKGKASDQYGIAKVRYKRNNNTFHDATGTNNWQFIVVLSLGDNKIQIEAVDKVGNHSTLKKFTIKRTN